MDGIQFNSLSVCIRTRIHQDMLLKLESPCTYCISSLRSLDVLDGLVEMVYRIRWKHISMDPSS